MKEGVARIALGVVSGLLLTTALASDLPRAADGRFWSDGASYHAMADSLATDGDVEFGSEDLARVRRSYPGGPQGVFLKRVGPPGRQRLLYAKSLAYPLAAAPFVRALGPDRALPVLNALLLAAALWLGYGLLRQGSSVAASAAGSLAVICGGVAPAYLLWQTPEVFNLAVITGGFFLWRRGRPLMGAALIGLAAYAKPTNLALALPLLLDPFLAGGRELAPAARRWRGACGGAALRALVVLCVIGAGFGLNRLATGEWNYQGGERKTFYDRYPGDPGVTFDSAGVWMITDHVGPLVAGRDDEKQSPRVAPARSPAEIRQAFLLNLGYFWFGRFAGALPYFPGVCLAVFAFLLVGPRRREGWLALVALAVSWVGYLLIIPDNWYGGSGTLGNRYFLNLVPLGFLLLPHGRAPWVAGLALPLAGALLGPILASPVRHALQPGAHTTAWAFRQLPAELTMLGDLSIFTDVWRKRRPYNGAELEPGQRPSGRPAPYFLWFLDDGTYGQERSFGQDGFWIRGGGAAQVVVQALARPRTIRFVVTAGPAGDIVTVRLGQRRERLVLPPLGTREAVLEPLPTAVGFYGHALYSVRVSSRYSGRTERDARRLGSFVRVVLE